MSIVVLYPLQRIGYDQVVEASLIGLTLVTPTDCRMEDIESGKYILVFASAKNALVKPFFSLLKKKATPFHQSMLVCIKLIMAYKFRKLLFVLQSIV